MTKELIDKLQNILGDINQLTPEKMEDLVQTTLETFKGLKDKMESTDPADREEALQIAETLKTAFEAETEKLYNTLGMDRESLAAFMANPANFSQQDWESVSNLTNQVQALNGNDQKKKNKKMKQSQIARLVV